MPVSVKGGEQEPLFHENRKSALAAPQPVSAVVTPVTSMTIWHLSSTNTDSVPCFFLNISLLIIRFFLCAVAFPTCVLLCAVAFPTCVLLCAVAFLTGVFLCAVVFFTCVLLCAVAFPTCVLLSSLFLICGTIGMSLKKAHEIWADDASGIVGFVYGIIVTGVLFGLCMNGSSTWSKEDDYFKY